MLRYLLHLLRFKYRRFRRSRANRRRGRPIKMDSAYDPVKALLDIGLMRWQLTEDLLENWGRLTYREQEVALLVLQGLKNNQIADRLTISVETVRTHTHNILEKFGLHSKQELRHAIWTSGIVEPKKTRTGSKMKIMKGSG